MVKVIKDLMGSESYLVINKQELNETTWDSILFNLGYEHVDPSENVLELTIIGSSIYSEEMNNAKLV